MTSASNFNLPGMQQGQLSKLRRGRVEEKLARDYYLVVVGGGASPTSQKLHLEGYAKNEEEHAPRKHLQGGFSWRTSIASQKAFPGWLDSFYGNLAQGLEGYEPGDFACGHQSVFKAQHSYCC